ncbi:DUF11 domain-containing protein [Streptomyces sp. NPDC051940]|uniref:DUF11 domain-containing protein n=1 Tax=Streptomyces sp. NPDC051940 TaxID=3155675 RepID=UPI0034152869
MTRKSRRRYRGLLAATAALCTAAAPVVLSTAPAVAAPAAEVVVKPFQKVYSDHVYGDFLTVGNTVLGCPPAGHPDAAACEAAAAGTTNTNNNSIEMMYVDRSGAAGTYNSSTGEVAVPPGAEVVHAELIWGGNTGTYGTTGRAVCDTAGPATQPPGGLDPLTAQPLIRVANGPMVPVTVADSVADPANGAGPHYYSARADVTSFFAGVTGGTDPVPVSVGNVFAPQGKGCVGGWSLQVVYAYDGPDAQYAPTRRAVDLYYGHVRQGSGDAPTTVQVCDFYRYGTATPNAGVSALEGDRGTSGDKFRVNGTAIKDEHTNSTNNFFDSTADGAVDPGYVNTLGLDAKKFPLPAQTIPAGSTCADLTFETNGDTYVPFQVALSVPIPDLEFKKTAAPMVVRPGDLVTYTVTVTNTSEVPYPKARFSDDLAQALDDAGYGGGEAGTGDLTYGNGRVAWSGDLAPDQTATIRYTVRLNDPPTGDGLLHNAVSALAAETPRTNCDETSQDPNCAAAPHVADPQADLRVVKRVRADGPVGPGDRFVYKVRVTNKGPYAAHDVTAGDTLPGAIDFVRSTDGCTAKGQKVTCGPLPELGAGESYTWTFRVRLDPGYRGSGSDLGNVARVWSTTHDPQPGNNVSPEVVPPLRDKK